MRTQIFISYRRDGGLEAAKGIYDALHETYDVFFDMKSLRNGRFDLGIEDAIKSCSDFVLILSKNVFDRYNDEGDWISRETKLALEYSKNIIPIFIDGFENKSDDETVNTLLNYNGIPYKSEGFVENLLGFLTSNKKCVLELECSDGRYVLSPSAIEVLKETHRHISNTGDRRVYVQLKFPTAEELADSISNFNGGVGERNYIIQKFNLNRKKMKERLEVAIEYMIFDDCNPDYGALIYYLSDNPLTKEYYLDDEGIIKMYSHVAVWQTIIEEMLVECSLLEGRYSERANTTRDKLGKIYCMMEKRTKHCTYKWDFLTFAPREETPESVDYYYFMRECPLILSADTILRHILPDFYINVARVFADPEKLSLQELFLKSDEDIRYLFNYWFVLS